MEDAAARTDCHLHGESLDFINIMARVPLIEETEHPELAESIAKIKGARGGRLINIYRLMLHSPALANAWFELNQAVRYGTEIDGQSRELAVIRVAILNDVDYVQRAHGPAYALKEGLTAEQVARRRRIGKHRICSTISSARCLPIRTP